MRVADIYAEASDYLGTNDETHVFRVLTRAVEYLAAKGDWDVMKGYVDLPIQMTNLCVLPWQVEVPLKFTINNVPAFSKDRLYEFTLNGFGSAPGSNGTDPYGDRVDYSWEDRGFVPYSILPTGSFQVQVSPNALNAGKRVIIAGQIAPIGIDAVNNAAVSEVLTIDPVNVVTSAFTYTSLLEVNKEVTTEPVSFWSLTGGTGASPAARNVIAIYFQNETSPKYRLVRLSQIGYTARFLFRRKVWQIVSMDDFIPVQSQLGLLTMVQSIQALRRKDLETAKAMADAAVEITTDAQRATTGFIELANNTEEQAARNYQIYNRDSVIVLDVYDEVAKILGNVGQFKIFDAITNALEILCAKGHWDGFTGYVDIQTDGWRNVTLPRFVDQPISIAINGRPAYMRNKWSEFHLNGPGSDEYGGQWQGGMQMGSWYGFSGSGRWGQISAWDSVGEVCTIKPIGMVSQLVAIPDDPNDDGKIITVYGYDQNGKWIRSGPSAPALAGYPTGQASQDGFEVVVNHTKLVPVIGTDQQVARIVRITRQPTRGFVRLWAFDNTTQTTSVLLGYWYPDETEPKYFRIKVPLDATWIRLRYRKRTLKVTSVWQPLHMHSRMAVVTMVRALKTLETDAAQAQVFEDKAVRFLDEDQKARNPGETFQLQFDEGTGWNSNFITS
jgi:hypothetical protein